MNQRRFDELIAEGSARSGGEPHALTSPKETPGYDILWRMALRNGPRAAESGGLLLCVVTAIGCNNGPTDGATGEHERSNPSASLHRTHNRLLAHGAKARVHLKKHCNRTGIGGLWSPVATSVSGRSGRKSKHNSWALQAFH